MCNASCLIPYCNEIEAVASYYHGPAQKVSRLFVERSPNEIINILISSAYNISHKTAAIKLCAWHQIIEIINVHGNLAARVTFCRHA